MAPRTDKIKRASGRKDVSIITSSTRRGMSVCSLGGLGAKLGLNKARAIT